MKDKMKNLVSDLECTAFPEGNWHECCVAHDWAYAEGMNKWVADSKLAWCVTKKKHPVIGFIMWFGATVGGWKAYKDHKEARENI